VLGVLGGVVGCTITFSSAAVVGALLHIDTPVARRVAASQITSLLASTFEGKIAVENVGHLGSDGAGGIDVRVSDPDGFEVLRLQNVRAKLSVLAVLKSVVAGGRSDMDVALSELTIDDVHASLDTDAKGNLKLLNAFEARDKTPSKPDARGLKLQIDRVALRHAWVHGQMQGAPPIDADASGLDGAVLVAPKQTTLDVRKLAVATRGMPSGASPRGDVEGQLAIPSKTGKDMGAELHFRGDVGGIPATADALLDGQHVDAVVDVRATAAEKVRALVREAPVYDDVTAHAEVHGELPNLAAKAHVQVGKGNVDVDGTVALGNDKNKDTHVDADITAKDLDVHAFAPTAPVSTLGAVTKVRLVAKEDGTIAGDFSLALSPGKIGVNVVPAAELQGDFAKTLAGPRVRAKGHVAERGAPTDLTVEMRPENNAVANSPSVVDFDVHTTAPSLEGIARVGPIAKGRAKLHAQGKIKLGGDQGPVLDAKVVADLDDVAKDGAAALRHGELEAHATGPLANPFIDATFEGEGLEAAGMKFATIGVRSRGEATSPEVHARLDSGDNKTPTVEVHASIAAGGVTTIKDVRLAISKDDAAVVTTVAVVRIAGSDVRVERGVIEGLGQPMRVDAHVSRGRIAVAATCEDIDLAKLAHLVNAEDKVKRGHLALDVDMVLAGKSADGRAQLDLSQGRFEGVNAEAQGHIDATIHDRKVFANVRAQVGDAGYAYVNTSTIELAGAPLDPASWARASGKAEVDLQIDLGKASALVGAELLPVGETRGQLIVAGSIGRDRPEENPEVDLSVQTRGLVLAGKSVPAHGVDGTQVVTVPPWRVTGIDVGVDAHVDADTGQAELAVRLNDKEGALVAFDSKAELPYGELFAHPDHAAKRMETVTFKARLIVPKRKLDSLPTLAGTKGMRGTVDLDFAAEGTVRQPKLSLTAHATGVKSSLSPLTTRVDTEITAAYDGALGDVKVKVNTPRGGQVLDGAAQVHAKVDDLLDGGGEKAMPWDASASVKLNAFPLQTISAIGDAQVKGNLSGEVTLTDLHSLHKRPKATADLKVAGLQIANAKYKGAALKASVDSGENGRATADLRVEQKDGFVAANVVVPTRWGARLAPELDPSRRLEAGLKAHQFRIAAAQPFLEGTFDELDGKLDANVKLATGGGAAPKLGGQIKLTDGVIQSPAVGEAFHGVTATVDIHEDGTILAHDIVAHGSTGSLEVKGKAKMNGLAFDNASLDIHVPTREPLPIAVQGVEVGEAYGDIAVKARAVPKGIEVAVDVPRWHMTLPATTKNTVQELAEGEDIRIGVRRAEDKTLVLLPIDAEDLEPKQPRPDNAMQLTVKILLGDDLEIKKGTGLKVGLDGNVEVRVTDAAHVGGQIRLKSGILEVQGKRFKIEKGTVTFVGDDPGNPQIVVTASWAAADGTLIYADFVGPLKTGKVTLHSEPARPKNEILALIMFGSVDGSGNPNGKTKDTASQAVSSGGGVATQGLNEAVSDLTGMDKAEFRVDTSTNNPRPELEYQVTKSIAVGVAYVMGVPPPDMRDVVFAKADWRFRRNWSLQTMFGNLGSTILDAVWQKRY
jgi:translocation and assembly module TamB